MAEDFSGFLKTWRKAIAVVLLACLISVPGRGAIARSSHGSHSSGSHYVHSYCRKNRVCVCGHMAGNPGSGEQWHLNKDGSDTVTYSNGTKETVPEVALPK